MFFAALDKPHKNARVTRSALALTMRTALRSRELRGGRWSEVAVDGSCPSSWGRSADLCRNPSRMRGARRAA